MSATELEKRVAALESQLAQIEKRIPSTEQPRFPWWQRIAGAFAQDPEFLKAMRLGREYRKAQRPRRIKKK